MCIKSITAVEASQFSVNTVLFRVVKALGRFASGSVAVSVGTCMQGTGIRFRRRSIAAYGHGDGLFCPSASEAPLSSAQLRSAPLSFSSSAEFLLSL